MPYSDGGYVRNGNDRIGNGNDEAFFLILMLILSACVLLPCVRRVIKQAIFYPFFASERERGKDWWWWLPKREFFSEIFIIYIYGVYSGTDGIRWILTIYLWPPGENPYFAWDAIFLIKFDSSKTTKLESLSIRVVYYVCTIAHAWLITEHATFIVKRLMISLSLSRIQSFPTALLLSTAAINFYKICMHISLDHVWGNWLKTLVISLTWKCTRELSIFDWT